MAGISCRREKNLGLFSRFHDELLVYFVYFLNGTDLLHLSTASPIWYVFCTEEPLWMAQTLRLHCGNFIYDHSWRTTCFWPKQKKYKLSILPISGLSYTNPSLSLSSCVCSSRYDRIHVGVFIPSMVPMQRVAIQLYIARHSKEDRLFLSIVFDAL